MIVNDNIDTVERLHAAALTISNEHQWAQISGQLESMKQDTQGRNLDIKARLTMLENSSSKDGQIRKTQVSHIA